MRADLRSAIITCECARPSRKRGFPPKVKDFLAGEYIRKPKPPPTPEELHAKLWSAFARFVPKGKADG